MLGHDILLKSLSDKRQAIEQILLMIHLSCQEAAGGLLRARRVDLRHQAISSPVTYRRSFGCDVRFGQVFDALVYGEEALSHPIVACDAIACGQTIEWIDAAFRQHEPPFHVAVRGLITDLLRSERCTNDEVTKALSVHPRTMHRRLREDGMSFQRVKDEVRRDMLIPHLE